MPRVPMPQQPVWVWFYSFQPVLNFFVPPLSAALVSTTQNWAYIAAVTASLSILGILMTLLLFKRYAQ
jgi:hypothetical protein